MAEEHFLTTEDGYKILVERAYAKITKGTPVILAHALFLNSLSYVIHDEKSLAHLLGKLGYDVWLLNVRGTKYSRGHEHLVPEDKNYWKYTVDDLGFHDVRSTVNYVHKITKRKPIYIGYSLGTVIFFMYASSVPKEEQLVKGMIGLGPVVNFVDIKSPIRFLSPVWSWIKKMIVYKVYNGEVHSGLEMIKPLLRFNVGRQLIQYIFSFLIGDNYNRMDHIATQKMNMTFDSSGAELVTQLFQIYESGLFQKYDYGKTKNLESYGMERPPVYNISDISVPMALFIAEDDYMSSNRICRQYYLGLQPSAKCGYHEFRDWGHSDLIRAKDVVEQVYLNIIDKVEDIDLGRCGP